MSSPCHLPSFRDALQCRKPYIPAPLYAARPCAPLIRGTTAPPRSSERRREAAGPRGEARRAGAGAPRPEASRSPGVPSGGGRGGGAAGEKPPTSAAAEAEAAQPERVGGAGRGAKRGSPPKGCAAGRAGTPGPPPPGGAPPPTSHRPQSRAARGEADRARAKQGARGAKAQGRGPGRDRHGGGAWRSNWKPPKGDPIAKRSGAAWRPHCANTTKGVGLAAKQGPTGATSGPLGGPRNPAANALPSGGEDSAVRGWRPRSPLPMRTLGCSTGSTIGETPQRPDRRQAAGRSGGDQRTAAAPSGRARPFWGRRSPAGAVTRWAGAWGRQPP